MSSRPLALSDPAAHHRGTAETPLQRTVFSSPAGERLTRQLYRDLTPPSQREEGFLRFMENEIVVDIGLNGERLFVSGKHRYSIARTLGLDETPVTFLVRHAK